jgi:hypothetical protein
VVLEAADLVTTQRRGREKLHFLNAEPIRAIADRWIKRYDEASAQPSHQWRGWQDALRQP